MNKYLVEFIGTFFLVLVIGLTAVFAPGAGNLAPLAIGSILMVMIYSGGPISGAHFNPAVSLGVLLRGKLSMCDFVPYIVVQLAGAIAAAFVAMFLKNSPSVEPLVIDSTRALVAELLGTFALVYVILNVATSEKSSGNSYFGLAIGFTVLACAYAFGSFSGGAFNPAVVAGLNLYGVVPASNIWIYLVGNFGGGALAALVFKVVNCQKCCGSGACGKNA